MSGSCPCQQTTFTLRLALLLVHACYCQTCQRQTGSILVLNAIVETSALQVQHPPSSPTTTTTTTGYLEPFARSTGAGDRLQHNKGTEAMSLRKTCVPSLSGVGTTLVGCPTCGTTVYAHYADAGRHLAYLRVGLLDRARDIAPDAHIYIKEKASFVEIKDGKP